MNLEVRHLRLVVAIAETGNVTRAAQRLNLTQSGLSHQLREIEGRLGVPLFLRTGKRMELAVAGRRVLSIAQSFLKALDTVENEIIAEAHEGPEGSVRIATECYTCYHWLPKVLTAFRRAHARIKIEIVPQATRRPLRALANGDLDVAIVTQKRASKRFQYATLFRDEFVVIAPPDHPIASLPFASARDLADEPIVLYDMPDDHSTLISEILYAAGLKPGPVIRVQLTEAVIELVKAGFGISAMAQWAAAPHIDSGALVAIPLGKRGYQREWMAAFRADKTPPSYVSSFIETLSSASFSNLSTVNSHHR